MLGHLNAMDVVIFQTVNINVRMKQQPMSRVNSDGGPGGMPMGGGPLSPVGAVPNGAIMSNGVGPPTSLPASIPVRNGVPQKSVAAAVSAPAFVPQSQQQQQQQQQAIPAQPAAAAQMAAPSSMAPTSVPQAVATMAAAVSVGQPPLVATQSLPPSYTMPGATSMAPPLQPYNGQPIIYVSFINTKLSFGIPINSFLK